MNSASNVQPDFRGGEWSTFAQGRMDDKEYGRALNICYNSYPTEEGAWTRRQGTRWVAYTRNGLYAWLATFAFAANAPYVMEFTDSALRFISSGAYLVMTNDAQSGVSIDTSDPAVVTTGGAHGWATGDMVQFLFPALQDTSAAGLLINRQFTITVTGSTTFTIADSVTGIAVDGSTFTAPLNLTAARILILVSPYLQAQLPSIRTVQAEVLQANDTLQGNVITLHPQVAPQTVINSVPQSSGAFAQFTIGAITFKDGPYFDPITTASVTPGALTGTVSITGFPASTFVSTDVGRLIRIFSEPLAWASGTAYVTGDIIKYTDNNYYTAVASSTGKAPPTNPVLWALNPTGAAWAWGTVTAVDSATAVHVAIDASQPLLYTTAFTTFRLGVYSDTTGYPACGVFTEGRLWLAGAQGNRFDASVSNDIFNFAPTAPDGTVADDNAISYTLNSDDVNPIFWMVVDHTGIICGTQGGEWLITASQLNDPFTPTSIQARQTSKYRCANTPPARAGFGLLFVKAFAKRLMEYTADVFSGKFLGRHISEKAQQITAPGIAQIVYQQDLEPNAWLRMQDGSLGGVLYRRDSSFTSEGPVFTGWHRHTLGSGCTLESIATGPNSDGTLDSVFFSALDPTTGNRHIEFLMDMFTQSAPIAAAWFVDGGAPAAAAVVNVAHTSVTFYGFTMYIGKTISLWVGGLDLGDYLVASDGSIAVTLGGAAQSATVGLGLPLFTFAFFSNWNAAKTTSWDTAVAVKFAGGTPALGVQSFIDTSVVAGTLEVFDAVYDPNNDRLVTTSTGHATTDGIRVFSISTGLQTAAATAATLFSSGAGTTNAYIKYPYAIDVLGNMYWLCTGGNSQALVKCDLSKMKIVAQLGQSNNHFATNQNHIAEATNMVSVNINGSNLLVTASITNRSLSVINTDLMQWANFCAQTTEADPSICAGPVFNNGKFSYAYIYAIAQSSSGGTTPLGVYTLKLDMTAAAQVTAPTVVEPADAQSSANTGVTLTRTGQLAPTDIDATWTNIEGVWGPVFDQTDGNIIIWAFTTDAVTNTKYVIKVNPATAAIVWQTAVANTPIEELTAQNWSVCNSGTFVWMSASNYYECDTASGAVTATSVTGFSVGFAQWYDANYGRLYTGSGSLSGGAGSPARINGTPATFSSQWSYIQGQTAPPAVSEYFLPVLPAVGGYTFTSQGQRLRAVASADTGAKNGPGFAKTRQVFKGALQLAQTQGIFMGTILTGTLRPVALLNGATPLAVNVLFDGVIRQEVDDVDGYDGMLCWQITRPYPATVTAAGDFLDTRDL